MLVVTSGVLVMINNSINQQPSFTSVYAKIGDNWVNFSKKGIEVSSSTVKKNYKRAASKEALLLSSADGKERLIDKVYIKGVLTDLKVILTGSHARKFTKTTTAELKQFFNKAFNGEMIFKEISAQKVENLNLVF